MLAAECGRDVHIEVKESTRGEHSLGGIRMVSIEYKSRERDSLRASDHSQTVTERALGNFEITWGATWNFLPDIS